MHNTQTHGAQYIITIDAGTTNTRVQLWKNGAIAASAKSEAGVRDTARTGSTDFLAEAVAGCLQEVTSTAGISPNDVSLVLASGMITSNLGLKEIPHLVAPAGLRELADAMVPVELPRVWPKPMWFITGVRPNKGKVAPDDVSITDMMRGEETEMMALVAQLKPGLPCWLALPGSHSKYIPVDEQSRIAGSLSTLAGEMFHALASSTILASSVSLAEAAGDEEWLKRGFELAREQGLGRALYCVRLSQLWCDSTPAQRTSLLLGAVLQSDVHLLRHNPHYPVDSNMPIWVAGRKELKTALATLLRHDGYFRQVHETPDDLENLAAFGAMAVAKERGLLA